jgi:hypothetical protein
MATVCNATETIRAQHRPERVLTLFVGESAPHSGDFFYSGDPPTLGYMRRVVEEVVGKSSDNFLETFKAYGWYLDDLVLTPVDKMAPSLRRTMCREAQASLATRIAAYHPQAIVVLLKSIERYVRAAAAGSNAVCYTVPFPGNGQQNRFHADMIRLIPLLPRRK